MSEEHIYPEFYINNFGYLDYKPSGQAMPEGGKIIDKEKAHLIAKIESNHATRDISRRLEKMEERFEYFSQAFLSRT